MESWRLLLTPPARGAWNMAVDEAILDAVSRGASQPTLRLYTWEPPCLSLGYAQPIADVDIPSLKNNGWEIVRRATGGRAILHTDELTYSVCSPFDDRHLAGSVLESYKYIANALLAALKDLGIPAQMKEDTRPDSSRSNPVCFEVPSSYEITAMGKKLIGSAQVRRKDGILQHGSLPLSGDLSRITRVLVFPNESTRKVAEKRLLARATTVESVLGNAIAMSTVTQAFVWAFETVLKLNFEPGVLSSLEEKRADELIQEKYTSPPWTERL